MTEGALYERLGERDGIYAVVEDFYDRLLADPDLGPFFEGTDVAELRRTQTDFFCEAAGGPETHDGQPMREARLDVLFEPFHIEWTVEHLEAFAVPASDADTVVAAVVQYEADLLERDDDRA